MGGQCLQICCIALWVVFSTSCTIMTRPLVRLWCSKSLKAVVYLADGICAL